LLFLLLLGGTVFGGGAALARASVPRAPLTVSRQTSDAGPAIRFFNGAAYIGWTGRNAAHNLNLMTFDGTTKVFGPAIKLTDTTVSGSGPSLAVFNGNLYVSWRGTINNRLNVARFNSSDPTHLADKVTLSQTSVNAPSIATFNGRLYLSWRGTDGRLNIISSADAHAFNTKVTYSIQIRTSPTLFAQSNLFLIWEESSSSAHIVVGQYSTSHPSSLTSTVTTTSTSTLPVGVENGPESSNPRLQFVWRTASDSRIRSGVWTGSANLTGITVTQQTTDFGPTIDGGALCWTGNNAARNVNVAPL
jgi:hypothetical protein